MAEHARSTAASAASLPTRWASESRLQIIALLLARRTEAHKIGPSLIVCPASLVYNWVAEFERFAPELDVRPIVGTKRERVQRDSTPRVAACDVFITSYDLLRIDSADLRRQGVLLLHPRRSPVHQEPRDAYDARASSACNARHRFALTGTPMENRLSELWSIFDFLMPGLSGIVHALPRALRAVRSWAATTRPLVACRRSSARSCCAGLKTDVLRDLPDKLESVVLRPLGRASSERLYAAHEQQLREALTEQRRNRKEHAVQRAQGGGARRADEAATAVLRPAPALRELRRCGAAKLDAIVELVESARGRRREGARVLPVHQLPCAHRRTCSTHRVVPHYTLTRARRPREAPARSGERVQRRRHARVPRCRSKRAAPGSTSPGASIVVHADPWWNAAAQNPGHRPRPPHRPG